MIDLKNLDKWVRVAPGEGYEFAGRNQRTTTLEIRAETSTSVYLYRPEKEGIDPIFLCNVDGYQKVRFRMPEGRWAVCGDEGAALYVATIETEAASIAFPDTVIFTKIAERRARDPRLEMMMFKMNQNLERRLQAQRAEDNRALEQRRKVDTAAMEELAADLQEAKEALKEAHGNSGGSGAGSNAATPEGDNLGGKGPAASSGSDKPTPAKGGEKAGKD
jgi:hypothetical protein